MTSIQLMMQRDMAIESSRLCKAANNRVWAADWYSVAIHLDFSIMAQAARERR